jgi:Tol biopolymer transport system component
MLHTWWRRCVKRSPDPTRCGPQRRQLLVEPLEERLVMAVELISLNAAGLNSGNTGALIPLFPINTDTTAGGNYSLTSADGRYMVFQSNSGDLVTGIRDANQYAFDVFVRDRLAGTTRCVSLTPAGATGNGASYNPQISADGRYVVFESRATDLVPGFVDRNGFGQDIYVRDLQTNTTRLVSGNAAGTGGGNKESRHSFLSADGRFVAFASDADDLVAHDTNSLMRRTDVFLRNLQTNTTTLISINAAGTDSSNGVSRRPVLSPDGRYVAFESSASNLVTGISDFNFVTDVFVRDLQTGTTVLASTNHTGAAAGNDTSFNPVLSANGQVVAFESFASNLVAHDTNRNTRDIFVRDLTRSSPTLVSVRFDGSGSGNSGAFAPVLSADGRFVAFDSLANNLVPNDNDGTSESIANMDVFVRDVQMGITSLISAAADGLGSGNHASSSATISADGRYVAYESQATNLVAGFVDQNGSFNRDIFLRDRQTGTTTLVTTAVGSTTAGGNGNSKYPVLSADGRFVFFHGTASNLDARDHNGQTDVFVAPGPFRGTGPARALPPGPPAPSATESGTHATPAVSRIGSSRDTGTVPGAGAHNGVKVSPTRPAAIRRLWERWAWEEAGVDEQVFSCEYGVLEVGSKPE